MHPAVGPDFWGVGAFEAMESFNFTNLQLRQQPTATSSQDSHPPTSHHFEFPLSAVNAGSLAKDRASEYRNVESTN